MERKLIREYAFRMAELLDKRIASAKQLHQAQEYLQQLEAKKTFWMKVVHLPANSEHWEDISRYVQLTCNPQTTKVQLRASYKALEAALNAQAKVERSRFTFRGLG